MALCFSRSCHGTFFIKQKRKFCYKIRITVNQRLPKPTELSPQTLAHACNYMKNQLCDQDVYRLKRNGVASQASLDACIRQRTTWQHRWSSIFSAGPASNLLAVNSSMLQLDAWLPKFASRLRSLTLS